MNYFIYIEFLVRLHNLQGAGIITSGDLSVIVSQEFKIGYQCGITSQKANRILGLKFL